MTKDFFKGIIKRLILRNRFLKNKSQENGMLYTQTENCCISLLKKTKIRCYKNLNETKILDNKHFWKVVKTLFSNKSISGNKLKFTENGEHVKIGMKTVEIIKGQISHKTLKIYQNYQSFLNSQAKNKAKNTDVTTKDTEKQIFG